ncbi:transporter substrate-binding domain-containing protein [Clostridium sp. DL1XJH146]
MKKIKGLVAVLLATTVLVGLTACGTNSNANSNANAEENTAEENTAEVEKTLLEVIQEKGVMTVGNSPDYPPFETIDDDGEIVGFDIDLIKAVGEKLGVEIEIKEMAFDTIVDAVKSEQVNVGCSGFSITEERLESVDFSEPYLEGGQVVVTYKGSGIETIEDLNGEQVAVGIGSTCEAAAETIDGAKVTSLDDFNIGFVMLKNQAIKATVADITVAEEYISKNDEFVIVGEPLTVEKTAVAIKKGNDDLTAAISKAIVELKEDGTIDELKQTWGIE